MATDGSRSVSYHQALGTERRPDTDVKAAADCNAEGDHGTGPPPPAILTQSFANPATLIRYAFFTWTYPLLKEGARRQLGPGDMFGLMDSHKSSTLGARLATAYQWHKAKCHSHPLARALLTAHGKQLAKGGALLATEFFFAIAQAVVLGQLLDGLGDRQDSDERLNELAAVLSVLTFFRGFFFHLGATQMWYSGMETRGAAVAIIFRKILTLRTDTVCQLPSQGQLVSILTADVERFTFVWMLHSVWLGPLLIIIAAAIGWQ